MRLRIENLSDLVFGLALDIAATMLVLAGMVRLLLGEEKKRGAKSVVPGHLVRPRRVMISEAATGVVFVASAVPTFWTPAPVGNFLRFDIWYVALAVFFGVTTSMRTRG